jgi:hypothetical protein
MERETGIEPATNGLGSRDSTTELLPLRSADIPSLTSPQKHQQSAASDFSVPAATLRTVQPSIPAPVRFPQGSAPFDNIWPLTLHTTAL